MNRILLINTGGTFSAKPGKHGLEPQLSGDDILRLTDSFEPSTDIRLEDYCCLDSANIGPSDWHDIALRIGAAAQETDGVVILHGTDTMAYTSSMLSFMLRGIPIPVVLTGSQMPLGVAMSDAEPNLRCAVQMACSGLGGVYVAFDRRIMLGCRTSKVRTVSFNAFESINYPYVGEVNAFGLQLRRSAAARSAPFSLRPDYSDKIAVLKLFPGMDPEIFSFLRERGYEGIYIEGFGLGGVPFLKNDFTTEISRASLAGMPILVGSQCRYEGSNLSIYETGQRILECGGIPVGDMTQEAVVTKLMWGLGQTKGRDDIRALFSRDLASEISLQTITGAQADS